MGTKSYSQRQQAVAMSRVLHELGELADVRVCTDAEVTLDNMDAGITQWLPSVSRPGDTVFIYICTHGGRIEWPGRAHVHFLLPHDFIDGTVLIGLAKHSRDGSLPDAVRSRYDDCLNFIRRFPHETTEDIERALVVKTEVSEDLLGHWLQPLDHRQVVLILETCHSGGFSGGATEKGLRAEPGVNGPAPDFDFLRDQISRLNDLGQPGTVVLAACAADQSSYSLRASEDTLRQWSRNGKGVGVSDLKTDMCVMTYELVDAILQGPPRMTLAECMRCREGMRRYFERINAIYLNKHHSPLIPHQPHLFQSTDETIYLKP